MWGGILVRNSGVGFASLLMTLHLTRLVCKNGMTAPLPDALLLKRRHRALGRRLATLSASALSNCRLRKPALHLFVRVHRLRVTRLDEQAATTQSSIVLGLRRYVKQVWCAGTIFVAGFGTAAGCGGSTAATAPCTRDSECGTSHRCYFAIAAGCAAKGQCMPIPEWQCMTEIQYCGCDGTAVAGGCLEPNGYARGPVVGRFPCSAKSGDASK